MKATAFGISILLFFCGFLFSSHWREEWVVSARGHSPVHQMTICSAGVNSFAASKPQDVQIHRNDWFSVWNVLREKISLIFLYNSYFLNKKKSAIATCEILRSRKNIVHHMNSNGCAMRFYLGQNGIEWGRGKEKNVPFVENICKHMIENLLCIRFNTHAPQTHRTHMAWCVVRQCEVFSRSPDSLANRDVSKGYTFEWWVAVEPTKSHELVCVVSFEQVLSPHIFMDHDNFEIKMIESRHDEGKINTRRNNNSAAERIIKIVLHKTSELRDTFSHILSEIPWGVQKKVMPNGINALTIRPARSACVCVPSATWRWTRRKNQRNCEHLGIEHGSRETASQNKKRVKKN